jgi:hypothetical protein
MMQSVSDPFLLNHKTGDVGGGILLSNETGPASHFNAPHSRSFPIAHRGKVLGYAASPGSAAELFAPEFKKFMDAGNSRHEAFVKLGNSKSGKVKQYAWQQKYAEIPSRKRAQFRMETGLQDFAPTEAHFNSMLDRRRQLYEVNDEALYRRTIR